MLELTKEQKYAINHGDGDILVSASAGSGKTHVMTARAIRLISEKKATVKDILAVTFTESAALEMKERIYKSLIERINAGEEDLAINLSELQTADISTLHSFCGRIIRLYFFSANVSPNFTIIDEAKADELKIEAVEKVFRDCYSSFSDGFKKLLFRHKLKRSDGNLKQLVINLFVYASSEKNPRDYLEKYKTTYGENGFNDLVIAYQSFLFNKLREYKDRLEKIRAEFLRLNSEDGINFTSLMIDDINSVLNSDVYGVKEIEKSVYPLKFKRNLTLEEDELKKSAVEIRDELKKTVLKYSKHLTSREEDESEIKNLYLHTAELVGLVEKFAEVYSLIKREKNCLDFSDLEHFALKVLSDENNVKEIRQRYKYVFVDEYQDINGVQEEIIKRVSCDNLFMVGDVKQSIYGFRGCRPEIFQEKYDGMVRENKDTVMLNSNFRCAPNVIDTVNEIFSYSMENEIFGLDYKNTQKLISGGGYKDALGRSELHLLIKGESERSKETPRIYDVLEEALKSKEKKTSTISALITKIIEHEYGKEYYDFKNKTYKKIDFKDIAILTRNKTNKYIAELVEGLVKRGIPLTSEVKQNVCDFEEIKTLIFALKLVDNFNDDVALVSTLLSPIGGFSEEELSKTVLFYSDRNENFKEGFSSVFGFYLTYGDDELKERLTAFKDFYDKLRFISDFVGAKGVLNKLIETTGYVNYLYSSRLGELKVKRLNRFLSACVNNGTSLTIRELLIKIERSPEAFSLSSSADDNTVKMMTIHASKGLEFPVVIVCGLEKKTNTQEDSDEVMCDREYGLAVRSYDDENKTVRETLLRGIIKEKNRINRIREELRLFYVATTRAQYSLHLTVEDKEDKRKNVFRGADKFLDYLPASLPVTTWTEDMLDESALLVDRKTVIIGKDDELIKEKMQDAFSFRYKYISDTKLPLKSTVTQISQGEQKYYNLEREFGDETTDAERGTIAHALLYNYDFNSDRPFTAQVESLISSGIIDGEELKKIDLSRIEKALSDEIFKKIKSSRIEKEKAFICKIDARKIAETDSEEQVLLQGVIDLLSIGDDATVIDYKYSRLPLSKLAEKYAKQLDLYAYAVESVLNIKVKEKVLVNIFTGESVKID